MSDRGDVVVDGDLTVLFVDDYAEYVEAGEEYLECVDDAITVLPETCAAAALDRLSGGAVDCVVSDYEMPEMSGVELLESAREEHPQLPFILLTGHDPGRLESSVDGTQTSVLQKGNGTHTFEQLRSQIREIASADTGFCFDNAPG